MNTAKVDIIFELYKYITVNLRLMIMEQLQETLENLCNLSAENEIVEFKEAKNNYDFSKLRKYFSALSNEANLKGKPFA